MHAHDKHAMRMRPYEVAHGPGQIQCICHPMPRHAYGSAMCAREPTGEKGAEWETAGTTEGRDQLQVAHAKASDGGGKTGVGVEMASGQRGCTRRGHRWMGGERRLQRVRKSLDKGGEGNGWMFRREAWWLHVDMGLGTRRRRLRSDHQWGEREEVR